MVSEIYTKQSMNEENSSLFINSILQKDKNEGRTLKSEKSQEYSQKPQRKLRFHEFHLWIPIQFLWDVKSSVYFVEERREKEYNHVQYAVHQVCEHRRKIRLIESNAKCRYLTKLTCKVTLRQVFYLPEVPSPPLTPTTPYKLYCIRVYSILIHTGKGGGGRDNQREGQSGNSSQSRSKIPT